MEEKRCYGCMKIKSEQPVCEHCGYDNSSQNASHQLPAGTVLKEQYLIGKVLGQGGFGITYLGWDLYLDIPVAIKEYFPAGTVMRETSISMDVVNCGGDVGVRFRNNKERFMREAKMLARFSQVAEIVQIKNFFLANNTAYIVMEYIEGITLKQYVKDQGGSLHETEILELMEPVILALCKIHKAGLVHRDISPDNIMMLPEKIVKLLDFGAVRDVGETAPDQPLTKSTEAILKQGYAPIEQYQNRGSLGPWTDVYALCATMYYCAKGEVPPDAPERLLDEKSAQLQIPQLSSRVEEVIKHGMALRTQDRISSMEQLHQELFEEGRQEAAPALEEVEKPLKEPVTEAAPAMPEKVSVFRRISGDKVRNIVIAAIIVVLVLIVLLVTLIPGEEKNTNQDISGTPTPTEAPTTAPTPEVGATTAPTPETTTAPTAAPASSIVVTGTCTDTISWEFCFDLEEVEGTLTISGEGEIPDYYDIWNREGEKAPWSSYTGDIDRVIISEGITFVGAYAFAETKLQELVLPTTLTEIGEYAFFATGLFTMDCLVIPEGVRRINVGAFEQTNIREVILPESLEYLCLDAFGACYNLERVELRNPVTEMEGVNGYSREHNPFTIDPSSGVEPKGNLVISGYENSTAQWLADTYERTFESLGAAKVTPAPVSSIVSGKCNADISWELDRATGVLTVSGTGEIPDYEKPWLPEENGEKPPWHEYMEYVRKLVISEGITSIGIGAFVNPSSLQELELPSTLTGIGAYSFAFAENAFSETGVLEIPEGVIDIQPGAFDGAGMREVVLPNSLENLGHCAFGNCPNLRRVVLKNAETMMEGVMCHDGEINPFSYHFQGDGNTAPHPDMVICSYDYSTAAWLANSYGVKFESLGKVEDKVTHGFCGDSVEWEFNTETKTLTIFGEGELWHYATDPENPPMTGFTEEQLRYEPPMWQIYAELMEHVVFEPGVTVAHNCLLTDLPNLKTIEFGTLEWAYCMVHNCPQVEEIVIPESMGAIGAEIISRMEGLKKITILGASEVQTTAFPECPALEEIWFSKDAYLGENQIFMAWYEEEMVTIPENVVFYVYEGSDAERYAKEWNIPYVIRED